MALFAEGCTDGGTLFLNDGTFVGNSFGRTNITDELFH